MASNLASRITDGVRVDVRTAYVHDESSPKHQYYVFLYQVDITNESEYQVQLLRREWHIVDGYGKHRMVEGEGVVGKQPVLKPGESHSYVSGSHFSTPVGAMHGFYLMARTLDGAQFWVDIPAFTMEVPCLSN